MYNEKRNLCDPVSIGIKADARAASLIDDRCKKLLTTLEYTDSFIRRLARVLTIAQTEGSLEMQATPPVRPYLPDILADFTTRAENNNKMLEYIVNNLENPSRWRWILL
jgi:hypothetical protein